MNTDAIALLKEFFGAMRKCQIDAAERYSDLEKGKLSDTEYRNLTLADLRVIYDKYCDCAKQFPVGVIFTAPSFDPENPVLEVTERGDKVKVVIERINWLPVQRLQYTIIKTSNGLKVSDQVKVFDKVKNKFCIV